MSRMKMDLGQKQTMSFTKKVVIASGISMVVAFAFFFGLKMVDSEESMAGSKYVWNGSENSEWTEKKNWDGKKAPKKGAVVEIADYTNPPIIEKKSVDLDGLELSDGAELYVLSDLKVDDDVILKEGAKLITNKKAKLKIEGSLVLNGKNTSLTMRDGEVEIKENLDIISSDDSDSTLVRVFNGFLEVKGATTFLKDESSGNGLVDIKGGLAQFNELVEERSGYDNGALVYHVSGGQVDFYEDFTMEGSSSSSSFSFKESSPCDDAIEWEKKSYNRSGTEPIYVSYKDKIYRMIPKVTYAGSKDKPNKKNSKKWEEVDCEDYCELSSDWDYSKTYDRDGNGDEVYVSYKGKVYELASGKYWSKNEKPDESVNWTEIKQCASYSAATCNGVDEWSSTTKYNRSNASEVIEVFWDEKVYRMKTNKWYSQADEPGKTGKIWQYNRDCKSGSSGVGSSTTTADELVHEGGKIVFHKDWIRSGEFESKNDGTIEFKSKTNNLSLKENDKFINLTIEEDVELDVEGDVDVLGELDVKGKCSGNSHIKLKGTKKQKIKGGGKVANITFNNEADVTLEDDLEIEGELTLSNGDLELGDNDLILSGSTVHGNSDSYLKINGDGFVRAEVNTDAVIFPIGRNPYLPIIIEDGSGEEYAVGVRDLAYLDPEALTGEQNAEAVSETWYIQSGGSVNDVTITIGWDAAQEMSGFNSANCFVSYWEEGVSTKWTSLGLAMSTTENGTRFREVVMSSMSSNRYFFVVGSGNSALPVEFLYFDAKSLGAQIELTWATATETNNDFFEIQRSTDGVMWEALERVKGFGTTLQQQDYIAYDNSPISGLAYYRLKQVDFDGTTDYSDVKQVALNGGSGSALEIKSVYPNPFSSMINIELQLPIAGDVQVSLINSAGVTLKSESTYANEGVNSVVLNDLSNLEKGAYIVLVEQGGKRLSKTVLKR